MKKKLLSGFLAVCMLIGLAMPMPETVSAADTDPEEIVLEKSTHGNPVAGFNADGNIVYGGDPTVLVDGDTLYLYVGHDDTSSGGGYTMPDWLCYSTKDLKDWTYHGPIMSMTDVDWADNVSAWASQVAKHNGKYYLFYCAENKGSYGKEVGVAVSDSPTGPFKDQGIFFHEDVTDTANYKVTDPETGKLTTAKSLYGRKASFGWEDIDPTIWFDTDENGVEHPYLMWGNSNAWMCELNEDLLTIKDQNGDGKITQGDDADIWYQRISGIERIPSNGNQNDIVDFTEAPWLYRRQDENGEYYGPYYVFFAMHWREEMGYATSDDITSNHWTYGGKLMEPTATSNTNHPAVIDFKGHTYFVYHNGSLPGGSGFRRVICMEEFTFNEDGSIDYIQETATGVSGTKSQILTAEGTAIAHEAFSNPLNDASSEQVYPKTNIMVSAEDGAAEEDAMWEIIPGKSDKTNESYVSIESYNKPGMFLCVNSVDDVVLTRDVNNNKQSTSAGITDNSDNMTFRTLKGFAGAGVTFESVSKPGYYITLDQEGILVLDNDPDAAACTFTVDTVEKMKVPSEMITSIEGYKTKRDYKVGETVSEDDIRIKVTRGDGESEFITSGFTTNVSELDTAKAGTKTLKVLFEEMGEQQICNIPISILEIPAIGDQQTTIIKKEETSGADTTAEDIDPAEDLPAVGTVTTIKNLQYKVTKTDEYNTDGTNGTVTLVKSTKSKASSITVPAEITIGEYSFKVTEIGSKAFYKHSKLKTLTIGDNVKKIGNKALDGIHKKANIKVSEDRYNAVKKLLKSKTGYKKTMKIKKIKSKE